MNSDFLCLLGLQAGKSVCHQHKKEKRCHVWELCVQKGCMYRENKIGPKTDPWGAPYIISHTDDLKLFAEILNFLSDRYEENHLMTEWPQSNDI